MLTRIEIDGFKTFEKFSLDLGPFTVIVGPNASGKSNLFDAIQLLARLAKDDIRTALKEMRGEPQELFRRQSVGDSSKQISFAVEVLINPKVRDPWGKEVNITHTRIRYEITIERRSDENDRERLIVVNEQAIPIKFKEDRWRQLYRPSQKFRKLFLKYSRQKNFLSTEIENGQPSFSIHQEKTAGRKRFAQAGDATVLSSITRAEFPHLFALREEFRSWNFLQLDPASLRRPSSTMAPDVLLPDGSNLATVLARIQAETKTDESIKGSIVDISADLAALISGVMDVSINEDKKNREYRVDILMREGFPFTSRVISDGTLRILALLAMLHDPQRGGLICFEEPENGVHPSRLKALIGRLREMVTQLSDTEAEAGEPLTQLLLNSHSPVALSVLQNEEIKFSDLVSIVEPNSNRVNYRTRIRPIKAKDQGELFHEPKDYVTKFEVQQFLSAVEKEGAPE